MRTLPRFVESDFDSMRRAWELALVEVQDLGDVFTTAIALGNLTAVCVAQHDAQAARRYLRRALTLLDEHQNWAITANLILGAARLASRSGRAATALRLWGAYRRLCALTGRFPLPLGSEETVARSQLSIAGAEQALAEGMAMTIASMYRLAREEADRAGGTDHGLLTSRELEVARLVGLGRSNKEVARELGRSERTVENHVQHVFHKLSVSSRAQVGAGASEHGLLD